MGNDDIRNEHDGPRPEEGLHGTDDRSAGQSAASTHQTAGEDWKSIFHALGTPAFIIDRTHRILEVNPAAAQLFHDLSGDLVGKSCLEICHGGDLFPEHCPLEKVLATGEHRTQEMRVETAGKVFLVSCSPLKDRAGRFEKFIHMMVDITPRVKAEDALETTIGVSRMNEERLRLALETADEGLWEWDCTKDSVYLDPVALRIHNLETNSEGRWVRGWIHRIHPQELPSVSFALNECLAGRADRFRVQYRMQTSADTWKWISSIGKVTSRDATGVPQHLMGVMRDITAPKLAELALRESEYRFHELFNNLNAAVAVYEMGTSGDDILVKDMNPFGMHYFNRRRNEVIGHPMEEVFPAAKAMGLSRVIQQVARTGRSEVLPTRSFDYGGQKEWMESHVYRLTQNEILAVHERVTERKIAQEALQDSAAWFRSIFDGSRDAIFLLDEAGRFVEVNSAGCNLTGYSRNELKHLNLHDLNTVETEDDYRSLLEMLQGAAVSRATLVRKDSSQVAVEFGSSRITVGGETFVHAIVRDITERQQSENDRLHLEKQLAQAQKMEAIGTLAGGIAHDFNNILSAVIGYTEMALSGLREEDVKQRRRLEEVLKAGTRARELVRQILTFSRHSEEEFRSIQVKSLVKEALKLLRASLPTTIEIRQDIISDGLVLADPTHIHQIIINLCTNAAHAMRESGGILTVTLNDVLFEESHAAMHLDLSPGRYLRLGVQDTGEGMNETVRSRIFEPFYTTKERDEGTGMGLAMVHGIVTRLDGGISVYSEPGQGSVFNIYLPITKLCADEVSENEFPLPTGRETILFVDDEPALVQMGRQLLEYLGYTVVTAMSAHTALEFFQENPEHFDLLFTDMTMPGMTGAELAVAVMAQRPELPVIICSGFSAQFDEDRARDLGVRAYISKPILIREVAQVVRDALDLPSEKG